MEDTGDAAFEHPATFEGAVLGDRRRSVQFVRAQLLMDLGVSLIGVHLLWVDSSALNVVGIGIGSLGFVQQLALQSSLPRASRRVASRWAVALGGLLGDALVNIGLSRWLKLSHWVAFGLVLAGWASVFG